MLQTIHDKLKGIFAVAILVALGVVFVFWGVNFSTDAGGLDARKGIEVNGRELPTAEVQRNYQEQMSRMQAMMGEAGVPDEMQNVDPAARGRQAVRTELLRQRTDKLALPGERRGSAGGDPRDARPSRSTASFRRTPTTRRCNPSAWRRTASRPSSASTCSRASSTAASTVRLRAARPSSSAQVALRDELRTVGWVAIPASDFESAVRSTTRRSASTTRRTSRAT